MSVITITGRPGRGKTLNMTHEALLKFNAENSFIFKVYDKSKKKPFIYVNNIYSNYPILLKQSKKPLYYYDENYNVVKTEYNEELKGYCIFSNELRLFDMYTKYNFGEGASFYIDEIQAQYDSMEYKDFPDCIAHFFQHHRHLEYHDIFTNSQSLSRIIKRILVLSVEYWEIKQFRNFFNILGICTYKITYDLVAGNETKMITKQMAEIDYINRFFWLKPVFRAYRTKYLKALLESSIIYPKKQWKSLYMSRKQILKTFFPSAEQKEMLKNYEY